MSDINGAAVDLFRRVLEPGTLVAVTDGASMASSVTLGALSEAARLVGDVSLLLGWCIAERPDLDLDAFASVRATMGGYSLQGPIREGSVDYIPTRLGTMPRLLSGPLRPHVALTSMVPRGDGFAFSTEVGWARAAHQSARHVVIEESPMMPITSAIADIDRTDVHVVGQSDHGPDVLSRPSLDEATRQIGRTVASLVYEGCAVQVGPGTIGEAVLSALSIPVRVDSGIVVDAVANLDERGLLIGDPIAAYVAGSPNLYAWANQRHIVRGVEETLDLLRLSSQPLIAVNTALEIDLTGQVNVETVGGRSIAGIGGHADYALAASRSPGVSVIALPTMRGGRSTLVERLIAPTSTARTDVDVVVTEKGMVDLRGLSDARRREALLTLW